MGSREWNSRGSRGPAGWEATGQEQREWEGPRGGGAPRPEQPGRAGAAGRAYRTGTAAAARAQGPGLAGGNSRGWGATRPGTAG